jgi:uncharacterized protein
MMSQLTANPRLNIVPDTGFYIAAALKNGYARSYLIGRGTKFLTYDLFSSEEILLELQSKLESRKFGFDRDQVVTAIEQIRGIVQVVHPRQKVSIARDSDDNKILECALAAKAEVIVSFDKDLLVLKEYKGIQIIHPRMLQYMFAQKESS